MAFQLLKIFTSLQKIIFEFIFCVLISGFLKVVTCCVVSEKGSFIYSVVFSSFAVNQRKRQVDSLSNRWAKFLVIDDCYTQKKMKLVEGS